MKFSKELRVGLFAIIAGTLFYLGLNFLRGIDFFSTSNSYFVIYDDVDRLEVSSSVFLSGVAVGRVDGIKLIPSTGNHRVIIKLDIDNSLKINRGTKAVLIDSDLLGTKAIQLSMGLVEQYYQSGDTLVSEVEQSLIDEVSEKLYPIVDKLDTAMTRINSILAKADKIDIDTLQIMVQGTFTKINRSLDRVQPTITELNALSASLNDPEEGVPALIANANGLVDSLQQLQLQRTLDNVNNALAGLTEITVNLNEGKGSLGKLITDDSLYMSINKTIYDLDSLLVHLNQYPKHFFAPLGKSHKKIQRQLAKEQ